MNTRFVSYARFMAMLLIAIAVLFAPFYGNASAAPLKVNSPYPNDDIGQATIISTLPYTDISITDSTLATPNSSDPGTDVDPLLTICGASDSGKQTVWYAYTASVNGELRVDTFGSGYDTALAIWTGIPGSLNPMICNDDAGGTFQSEVRFPVAFGTQYYIEVAQFAIKPEGLSAQSGLSIQSSDGGNNNLTLNASFRSTPAINQAPSTPSLVSPAGGAIITTYVPNLDWSTTVLKTGTYFFKYELQASTNSNLSSPILTPMIFGINNSNYIPNPGLNPNTTYYWRVRACNTNGPLGQCSGWSATRYFRTAILPPVLVSPSNGPVPNLRPTFDWQNVTGAGGYNIQVSKYTSFSSNILNINVKGATASTYTPIVDLPANTTFFWRVRANAATGNFGPSGWSEVRTFTTPKPPSIPVLVSPANGSLTTNRQPTLDWKNSTLPIGVTTFGHYQIQVAADPAFASPVINYSTAAGDLTASQFTDYNYISPGVPGPLTPNTKYYWRVRSWDTADESGNYSSWSAVWSFREAMDPPALSAPLDNTALYTRRTTFDWSDVTGASGYTIQVSKYDSFSSTVLNVSTVGASTYTPTVDLPASSTLYWRVRANGANGPSIWSYSPPWRFNTPNPPSIPTLVSPTNGALLTNRRPTLDWNNATVPLGTTFDHYQIQIATDPVFSTIVNGVEGGVTATGDVTASIYTLGTDLNPNTKYYWRVRSWDNTALPDGNYSSWSAVWSFREAVDPPTLLAPTDGTALAIGVLRPPFDWDYVTGASGYTIQVSKVDNFSSTVVNANISGGSNSTFTPSANLPGGSKLYWRVRANGTNGPSVWSYSPAWSFTTPNAPPVLSSPANGAIVTDYTPTLTWVIPSLAPGSTLDNYEVQVATDPGFTDPTLIDDTSITSASTNQFTVTPDLLPNSTYYWRVSFAYTANAQSFNTGWSLVRSFKTAIPAPALISPATGIDVDGLKPSFNWDAVTSAASYNIQISKVSNFSSTVVNATTAALTFTPGSNLAGGTVYYWRVRANASTGNFGPSAWSYSPPWSFSTINLPPILKTPTNGSLTTNPPTLTWALPTLTPGSISVTYEVEIATDSAFANVVDTSLPGLTDTNYTPPALANASTFYWRVRYTYDNGGTHTTAWSTVWSFKTP